MRIPLRTGRRLGDFGCPVGCDDCRHRLLKDLTRTPRKAAHRRGSEAHEWAEEELTRTSGNPYREVMLDDVRIRPIDLTDAGEVFTLQRAAFIEEAHLYETVDTPALTQTFDELKAELASNSGCVALVGTRMVGSVTARMVGDVLRIGRLAVVPDMQGQGIGTRLLEAVEARLDAVEATLFTGALSVANLRLYKRQGYVETHRVTLPAVELVYLRKRLRQPPVTD